MLASGPLGEAHGQHVILSSGRTRQNRRVQVTVIESDAEGSATAASNAAATMRNRARAITLPRQRAGSRAIGLVGCIAELSTRLRPFLLWRMSWGPNGVPRGWLVARACW